MPIETPTMNSASTNTSHSTPAGSDCSQGRSRWWSPHSPNVHASIEAPADGISRRRIQNTQAVSSVTADSSTALVSPESASSRMPYTAPSAQPVVIAANHAYTGRQRTPRRNWSAASNSSRAAIPVDACWANTQNDPSPARAAARQPIRRA